jgi:hypothetical protein
MNKLISPSTGPGLRQRLIEDMSVHGFTEKTPRDQEPQASRRPCSCLECWRQRVSEMLLRADIAQRMRAGLDLKLDAFDRLGREIPVLADIRPTGYKTTILLAEMTIRCAKTVLRAIRGLHDHPKVFGF